MVLELLTQDVQITMVIDYQWGDTGKGKICDSFAAEWADVVARATGGDNAGHTVESESTILHLLPTGVLHNKISILGNGMAINPKVLVGELDALDKRGKKYDRLMISEDAHIIFRHHIETDERLHGSQSGGGIGTTKKGVGPCYTDKTARLGIKVRDLYDEDALRKGLKRAINGGSGVYDDRHLNSIERLIEESKSYAERIKPFVRDTIAGIHSLRRQGKRILIEGAQGFLLSNEFGTYPYTTCSEPSVNGTASGVGLCADSIDLKLGVVKYPFMTRVGAGPFPTELGGRESELHCAEDDGNKYNLLAELINYGIPFANENGKIIYDHNHQKIRNFMNSSDPVVQGIGIRLAAEEYGATTHRPRRIGWTDLVALEYAVGINGPSIILTKADCVRGLREYKLGINYDNSPFFTRDPKKLRSCRVDYTTFQGFDEDLSRITNYEDLPDGLLSGIKNLEFFTGANVRAVSTGPKRDQLIIKAA